MTVPSPIDSLLPMAWLLSEGLRDGFRRGELSALLGTYLAPVLFKMTLFDNAMKLGVIAAAAMLFAAVLRRMTEKPQDFTVRDSRMMANPLPASPLVREG